MTATPRRFGLIPAAGEGSRFGGGMPKQYTLLAGAPILRHAIRALNESIALDAVYVVLARDDAHYKERIGDMAGVVPVYCGGRTRAESVANGLGAIGAQAAAEDWILVHDAVRPCVDVATLHRLLQRTRG